MSNSARTYLVAYDISEDDIRSQVSSVLQTYGDRVQYSVFLIDTKPAKMIRIRRALVDTIDPRCDSVMICELGDSDASESHLTWVGKRRVRSRGPYIL